MDKFKKIKSKLFKPKPPKNRELRHSLSMPLRSSSDTEVFLPDIPPDSVNYIHIKTEERYPDWCQYKGDPDDFSRPYFPRRPYVEKIVDQFPAPPTAIPVKAAPKRPSARPPTMDFSFADLSAPDPPSKPSKPPKRPSVRPPTLDFSQFPDEVLLPEYPQHLKAKVDAFDASEAARNAARLRARHRTPSSVSAQQHSMANFDAAEAVRNAARFRARHRTPSSVSAQTQPLNIRRRGMSSSNVPAQPSGGMYANHAASQSTYSLDPRARSRAGLASHRQAESPRTHNTSNSSGMYNNSSAAQSAYHLSHNSRYPASDSSHAIPPLPQQHTHDARSASISRRNASSASSRSAHAMRRHGMLPPPEGSQHHEVLRILRGPHAVKLQTPSAHTRTNEDIGLPVNDTNSSKEWGAKSSRVGGAATVAGYGHSAGVQRY